MILEIDWSVDLSDGREDVECVAEAEFTGRYKPAQIYGDPDNSYPAEYPDFELVKVSAADTGTDITNLLTKASEDSLVARLWSQWWTTQQEDCHDDYLEDDYADYYNDTYDF